MNCPSQERLALHACGDVADKAIEAHLRVCAACLALARSFRHDAELLELEPVVPDRAVHALDASVRSRMRGRGGMRWIPAFAAVAAALAIALWLRPPSDHGRRTDPVAKIRPPDVTALSPKVPPRESTRVLAASRPRPRPRVPAASRPVEKLEYPVRVVPQTSGAIVIAKRTADPNVLILLVGEEDPQRGEPK